MPLDPMNETRDARPVKLSARGVRIDFWTERIKRNLRVLDGVDLDVREGELLAIVGPSGCGKSTFLGAVDGLVKTRAGEICVDGVRVEKPGADRAMVFQQDSLFPWRTVLRNISYGLELQGRMPKGEIRDRAASLVELVGLKGFGEHYPHELSGGMRQRVNIARALCVDPDVLLMDEPFGALDAQTREVMCDELLRIWERDKKTAVFVTHAIDEAIFLGDRVVVIGRNPGHVREVIEIDLPRPRTSAMLDSPAFVAYRRQLREYIAADLLALQMVEALV